MPFSHFPFFYNPSYYNRFSNYNNYVSKFNNNLAKNYSLNNKNANAFSNKVNNENYFSDHSKNEHVSSDKIYINSKNEPNKSTGDNYFFELFGLKLFFDDILLICIIFFLYQEGVKDKELFLSLILLLLS